MGSTNPRIRNMQAAKALQLGAMNEGRYADVNFNAVLLACIPFVAPAYLHAVILLFVCSHLFIYLSDTYRVLRRVHSFNMTDSSGHLAGMRMFSVPVAVLAGAFIFKANHLAGRDELVGGYLHGPML